MWLSAQPCLAVGLCNVFGQAAAGSLEDVGNVPEDSEEAFGGDSVG